MNSALRAALLSLCACAAGFCASEVLYQGTWSRNAIGELLGRGQFLGLVRDRAIFERDLLSEPNGTAETMLMAEALRYTRAAPPSIDEDSSREMNLLQAQFDDDAAFTAALEASQLSDGSLALLLADHLGVRDYLEGRIASEAPATAEECRQRFQEDPTRFELSARFRASHIFVAAPDGTPPDVMIEKQNLAGALSMRLLAGEEFARVAQQASDDKATKAGGGDLGYFSTWRMPSEFLAELDKLHIGEVSAPFRSHLGFHIVQLTEVKPVRALTFEEAQPEIATELANEKRAARVALEMAGIKRPGWAAALANRD